MGHLWDAEQLIEAKHALYLIQEQFPELCATTIRQMGAGWDNTAFIINEEIIFRFPRRLIAVNLLEEECYFLPKLVPFFPIEIPNPQWKGTPSDIFPWPFTGYKLLSGYTACHVNLSDKNRCMLVDAIANFLKCLHSLPIQKFPRQSFSYHSTRIDGNLINQKTLKNFKALTDLGLLQNEKALLEVIAKSQKFAQPQETAVVHGDFYVRHLMLNNAQQLSGVIDWGSVHIGDPAQDLAIIHSFFPNFCHDDFVKIYGEISTPTWHLSRLRAILSGTYLILFGHHSKDNAIEREGLRALQMISETA